MCGIVALAGIPRSNERTHRLRAMTASIAHRGPDGAGFFESESVAFGFRRLAILDLSEAGNQPMSTSDGDLTIVFNGEIYNYLELRSDLEALGHRFKSSGDTEVLLHSYLQWGADCVARLNGMWAFLIYDRRTKKVVGSRDRFGVKPLFAARRGESWLFASEIKALHASGLLAVEAAWPTVAEFFVSDNLDHSDATFFSGVRSIPAATWFELDAGCNYREHRFWAPPGPDEVAEMPDAPDKFAALFDDAIRLHQRSDVPLAVHLSGGLDSTSILCSLGHVQQGEGKPLTALSFMSDAFDERRFIADTVQQTGAVLRPLTCSPRDLWDSLASALAAHDEPLHSMTALVGYALMKETHRQGIKVVLNGQGADETLAGYSSYFESLWHELLRDWKIVRTHDQMRRFASSHRADLPRLIRKQVASTIRARLGRRSWYRLLARALPRAPALGWASPELAKFLPEPRRVSWDLSLNESLVRSIEVDPLPLYLRIEDRNAMAHSIESRVPFLDYRLVEMALRLPSTELMDGGLNKWLLRRAMTGRIPDSVRHRVDKMGFPVPNTAWLRGPLWTDVEATLNDRIVRNDGLFNTAAIDKDVAAFKRGDDAPAGRIFGVAQFAVWWRTVMKPSRVESPQASWRYTAPSVTRPVRSAAPLSSDNDNATSGASRVPTM